jgi:hypothetical protein
VFYVRVKWALEVKNHSISMEDKALAPYIADRDRDLFTIFLAGLPSKYREIAMSGENPPTDLTTLRKHCAQLEAMQSMTKRIAAFSAEVNEEKVAEESLIELLTKEIAALKAEMKCFNCQKKGHFASACPDPKKPKPGRGRGRGWGGKSNKGQGQGQGQKDNEEEEDNEKEEEVINLLPTTANTSSISHPLSSLTTAEEEAAEVDAVAPTPSAMRATALTPVTTVLTLATPAPARWAIRLMRTSTTAGLRETRPWKWAPHSHFPGRWQHHQQQQQ